MHGFIMSASLLNRSANHILMSIKWWIRFQGVAVAFANIDGLAVELVQPARAGSPIDESLRKGTKLIHICIEVPSLDAALAESRNNGFLQISAPAPATAFDGRRIVWVFSDMYGLFELLENSHLEK